MAGEASLLYHYTSLEGLKGILSTRKIWASDILYLNDSAEFNYAVDLLLSISKEKYSMVSSRSSFLNYIEWWAQTRVVPSVYVMAFSTESDQLSQWRGYCPLAGGFNIGFGHEKLKKYFESKEAKLDRCIYNVDEQFDFLDELAQEIYSSYQVYEEGKKFMDLTLEQKTERAGKFRDLLQKVLKLAPRIKHPSFSEENEWRLVIKGSVPEKKNVQYRISRSLLIPYVEVGPIDPDCFSQIIVGPCPHIDLSRQSVERFVRATLDKKIEVTTSKIPYRNW
jgi:hypothetical protein